MSVIVILVVVFLVVGLVLAASIALGRTAYEVDSARDTEYLDLEGNWIRYNVIGGGPPVVLVHGWLSSSRVWEGLAGRLAQRFTVYTLDLSGFGESDKPLSGYGIRYGSRLLYAFCAHFGLTRTSVIGHDIGGNMAVKLAADHPDVVGRLVLVSTPANEEQIDLPTPLWLATLPMVGPIFYTLGRLVRGVRRMWLKPFVVHPEDLTEDAVEDAAMSTPSAASKSLNITRREIAGGRLARQARIIKVPVLLVTGEEDQIVDPQAVGVWARSFPQAEVVLMDECGHMPMIERTAEFNAQVLAFLTGDARYLDYVEETRATEDEAFETDEEQEEYAQPVGEPGYEPGYEPADEEIELPPRDDLDRETHPGGEAMYGDDTDAIPTEPVSDESTAGRGDDRRSEPPTIHRKRGGSYSASQSEAGREAGREAERDASAMSFGNGVDGNSQPRDDYRDIFDREPRTRNQGTGKGEIPEVPEDLFSWPSSRREPRARDRSRERSREDEGDFADPETPPER
ncbi:MAG TPA: alpha/beta hydrolase [Rubrobacteraceae bacterium]|nr:alpha/beta hydrolase [Rubrobacteraceae bacterium]